MRRSERSLVTVLFTDIVGSTERAAELGDRAWRDTLAEFHAVARREIRRFGGSGANTAGDGFLATFERPARAIRCAGAVRAAVRELGLEVRSGIHAGEVEGAGPELSGIGVHIGSRVASLADPGEILVSSTVRDLVTGAGFRFQDRGKRALKGVPEEWRLYALAGLPAGLPARTGQWIPELTTRQLGVGAAVLLVAGALLYVVWAARDPGRFVVPDAIATDAAPAIAVLPFSVHGEELEVWREGMVDLLSTGLDGAGGLRTIDGRTVLARWKEAVGEGATADLATALGVARQAQARYALVGSAVSVEAQVRFVAEVYDLASGRSMGQTQVQGVPDSILTLVDRLGIRSLGIVLEEEPEGLPSLDLAAVTTSSLPALKAYLEGEARFRRSDFEGAAEAWERAVAADSLFALAWYSLSQARGWEIRGASAEGNDHAFRLVERLPAREALLVRSNQAFLRGSLEAVRMLEEAVRRYPDDAHVWHSLGDAYFHLPGSLKGPADMEEAFRRAVELQPDMAPYRAHLVDLAFEWHADSAVAARELEAYARLAPEGLRTRTGRVAFDLAFGGVAGLARATAILDTMELADVGYVANYLSHPRFLALREQRLGPLVVPRLGERGRPGYLADRFINLALRRGKLREALTSLSDPLMPDPVRACGPADILEAGLPVPQEVLDQVLRFGPEDVASGSGLWLACVASLAAASGATERYEAIVSYFHEGAERRLSEGDSAAAGAYESVLRFLDFMAGEPKGREEAALRGYQDLLATQANEQFLVWHFGMLAYELGRLEEAEGAFLARWRHPMAHLYLGRIYERTGRPGEAVDAYERFVEAWREADPELQPLVEEARQAAIRLRGLQRG